MKILIVHHTGIMGGGTLSCFDVIESIDKNKHNVLLFLPIGKNDARKKSDSLNINVLNEKMSPLVFGYYNGGNNIVKVIVKSIISIRYTNKWKEVLVNNSPDLVILNSMIQWPMVKLLNKLNIKNVCFIRETMKGEADSTINKYISKRLLASDGIAFLSEYDKKQWNLSSELKQSIIPDMVDIKKFTNQLDIESARSMLNLDKETFYILYTGGMNELKGAKVIVEAMSRLKNKKIKLLFLGETGVENLELNKLDSVKKMKTIKFIRDVYKIIKTNDLEDSIHFMGIKKDMNYWYAACDIVVFPILEAHQGRPIYEAGTFKKPVIASDFLNFNEYLINEVSGLTFEPGNHKDLSDKINLLYRNSALCIKLGEENYYLTVNHHDSRKIEKEINNFIL